MPNADDGNDADRQEFMDGMSTQVSHVLNNPAEIWVEHLVLSQPTTIFVSSDGSVEVHTGGLGPQKLLERVQALR